MKTVFMISMLSASAAFAQGYEGFLRPSQMTADHLSFQASRICVDYKPSRDYSQDSEAYERYHTLSILCEQIARMQKASK